MSAQWDTSEYRLKSRVSRIANVKSHTRPNLMLRRPRRLGVMRAVLECRNMHPVNSGLVVVNGFENDTRCIRELTPSTGPIHSVEFFAPDCGISWQATKVRRVRIYSI